MSKTNQVPQKYIRRKEEPLKKNLKQNLNERQEKFCENYLSNGRKQTQAAIDAGYSGRLVANTASKLMKLPHVKKYINDRLAECRHKYHVDFDYKIGKLSRIVEKMLPEDEDLVIPECAKTAIAAIAELNKMQGDYSAEKRANVNLNVNVDADLKRASEILDEVKQKYKCEY